MKVSHSLLIIALAGSAFAQAPAKPSAGTAQAGSAKPVAKPTLPATSPVASVPKKAATPVASAPKKTAPAKAEAKPAAKPAAKVKEAKKIPAAAAAPKEVAKNDGAAEKPAPELKRGRDPFVSIIMTRDSGAPCAGAGKKCLIIDQVTLKGIVRSQVGPIAVVTGSSNKTFFLRENDPVYNGVVVKITPDSIVFRETVTDRLGKSIQREVVKKVNNPAV
jgi:Tfp pilus assembly protein PilP